MKRLLLLAGLDEQVVSTLLLRSWSAMAGAVMVIFISQWFNNIEQGYYFTLVSLLALQVFFELGMNQVVLHLASHEVAHLKFDAKGHLKGDSARLNALSTLASLIQRWYLTAAIVFFVVVGAGGVWFLAISNYLPSTNWMGPWLLLILATSANLCLNGKLVFFEAIGNISGVARARLMQSMIGTVFMWAALTADAKLWALPLVPVVAALYTMHWLKENGVALRVLPSQSAVEVFKKWQGDVLPLQWRLAISWVSGYFIFQLLIPVVFASFGPVEAGRLGITLAIFGALSSLGMSWVTAKIPSMVACVAKRDRSKLNEVFLTALTRAVLFTVIATLTAVVAIALMHNFEWPIADRFVSVSVATCIALSTVINCIIFSAAAYMRSHKEEPMVLPSVVSAVATLVAVAIGSQFSVFAILAVYTGVTACISLPWTIKLLNNYYGKSLKWDRRC